MKAAAVYTLLVWLCASAAASEWETIRSCRLIENESNDGDSFHVDADGEERIFRLYFVDAPETDDNGRMADRIAEQAELFGITEEESLEMGKKAAAFTRAVLSRPFAVTTRGQNARGASEIKREYALVETVDGEDLGEMLVARGLARSFGQAASLSPYTAGEIREKYDRLELKAKREQLGAWGGGASDRTIALPSSQREEDSSQSTSINTSAGIRSRPLANPTDDDAISAEIAAFAIGNLMAVVAGASNAEPPAADPVPPKADSQAKPNRGKVSLNNATLAELEALPRIGPDIAGAIIAGRPYERVEDVDRVEGIGPKTLQTILPYIVK